MLFAKKTAAEKRADFAKGLKSGKLLRFPGAMNPLTVVKLSPHERHDMRHGLWRLRGIRLERKRPFSRLDDDNRRFGRGLAVEQRAERQRNGEDQRTSLVLHDDFDRRVTPTCGQCARIAHS